MRIVTYENPFELTELSIWDEMTQYPNLCVSQTLVEGLKEFYGREHFKLLCTIDSFLKVFYEKWHGSTELQVNQHIALASKIRQINNPKLKSSFLHNKQDVLKSIRFLSECEIDVQHLKQSAIMYTQEQAQLIKLYEQVKDEECFKVLDLESNRGEEGIKACIEKLLGQELLKHKQIKKSVLKETHSGSSHLLTKVEIIKGATKHFENQQYLTGKDKRYQYILELYQTYQVDDEPVGKIFIHGVHQFTPLMIKFFKRLEELNIEVIFVFNYCKSYKGIYKTWDEVYKWIGLTKEQEGSLEYIVPKPIGERMGNLFEGNLRQFTNYCEDKVLSYANLTSFSDRVAEIYDQAKEVAMKDGKTEEELSNIEIIAQMKEQFYAVNGTELNTLLKVYFPEHFGQRPFLSYPVGQFILALYNMWHRDKVILDPSNLKECLALNVWKFREGITPVEMYYDLQVYLKDVNTFEAYKERLEILKNNISKIHERKYERGKRLVFFNYRESDVDDFINVLKDLEILANELFRNGEAELRQSYESIIEYMQSQVDQTKISEKEKALIQGIQKRLEQVELAKVSANIADIRDTLTYYLSVVEDEKEYEAEWIVRDFEQIDGGVLLAKAQEEKIGIGKSAHTSYHYAGLSDGNMLGKVAKLLPWPLTIEFIDQFSHVASIIATCKKEYIHFLRYSLFYGTYFLVPTKQIKLSYIEEINQEKEQMYSVFSMLGLDKKPDQKMLDLDKKKRLDPYIEGGIQKINPIFSDSQKRSIIACPRRFLLNHCLDQDTYFSDELTVAHMAKMLAAMEFYYQDFKGYTQKGKKKGEFFKQYLEYFPFMDKLDKMDSFRKTFAQANDLSSLINYINVRSEFKYAKWNEDKIFDYIRNIALQTNSSDLESKKQRVVFRKIDEFVNSLDENFINTDHTWKVCDICNQKYVCGYSVGKEVE